VKDGRCRPSTAGGPWRHLHYERSGLRGRALTSFVADSLCVGGGEERDGADPGEGLAAQGKAAGVVRLLPPHRAATGGPSGYDLAAPVRIVAAESVCFLLPPLPNRGCAVRPRRGSQKDRTALDEIRPGRTMKPDPDEAGPESRRPRGRPDRPLPHPYLHSPYGRGRQALRSGGGEADDFRRQDCNPGRALPAHRSGTPSR
jgi:hypothetical protein